MRLFRPSTLQTIVFFLFALALLIRMIWWRFGATIVWPDIYDHPDSWQFVNAATNLVSTGTYTADPEFRDGLFTRVPGYTLIWALLHLVKTEPYVLMSGIQAILDSISALLVFGITKRVSGSLTAGLIGGLLYATYPFALFWITPAVPDVFTTFAALFVILLTLRVELNTRGAMMVGASCAIAVLLREYLLILPVALAIRMLPLLKIHICEFSRLSVLALLTFCLTYSPWPLRNIINHGEYILLRAETSGSRHYDHDVMGLVAWASLWTDDVNPVMAKILRGEEFDTPPWVWRNDLHRKQSFEFMHHAAECGSGLNQWRTERREIATFCTEEAAAGFNRMTQELKSREPIRVWTVVPLKNVAKSIFKSELVNMPTSSSKIVLVRLLFGWRTFLLLLGFVGVFLLRKKLNTWIVVAPAIAIYFALTFVLRGLQMRYLLQADVILLVFAGVTLATIVGRAMPSVMERVGKFDSSIG